MKRDKKTKPFPVNNIEHLINKNELNFTPDYQRGFVWKKQQKELFIESLFLDYDIPKIYLHEKANEDHKYDVVDGQQRLRTIYEFMKGKLKISSDSDPIKGEEIAGKTFSQLSLDLQMDFRQISLDVVILNSEYKRDDIEDMFLRYQNGEPLNAAEKRKAIPGEFRNVVKKLATHNFFRKAAFTNHRDAYEDAVAKILHVRFNDGPTSITPASIKRTYLNNKFITMKNPIVLATKKAFSFLDKAFSQSSNKEPKLKKFAVLTLTEVAVFLIETYACRDFKKELANAYLSFEMERAKNKEIEDEELQDATLNGYTDAARGDSPAQQQYRYDRLVRILVSAVPEMTTKDLQRAFTAEQRVAIFQKNEGICQRCNTKVDNNDFHADHILPHSKGGKTKIANGQVLCTQCNLQKGG